MSSHKGTSFFQVVALRDILPIIFPNLCFQKLPSQLSEVIKCCAQLLTFDLSIQKSIFLLNGIFLNYQTQNAFTYRTDSVSRCVAWNCSNGRCHFHIVKPPVFHLRPSWLRPFVFNGRSLLRFLSSTGLPLCYTIRNEHSGSLKSFISGFFRIALLLCYSFYDCADFLLTYPSYLSSTSLFLNAIHFLTWSRVQGGHNACKLDHWQCVLFAVFSSRRVIFSQGFVL